MIQSGFEAVVDDTANKCKDYFRDRLYSMYLTGSISVCEAVAGESDLDYWVFISDELSDDDKAWIKNTEAEIDSNYEVINGVHINVKQVEELYRDKFTRFALKYNSFLFYGGDIISDIESSGVESYEPNKIIAKVRLPFAKKCLEDAMENICPQCMDEIPENTYFAARKYARYFLVIEGAYYLMAINKFITYKQETVIQLLRENSVGFTDILNCSYEVLKNPLKAAVKHDDYIAIIYPFVEWMHDEINAV